MRFVWDKNITEQADVDAMAEAIKNAIAELEVKESSAIDSGTITDETDRENDS